MKIDAAVVVLCCMFASAASMAEASMGGEKSLYCAGATSDRPSSIAERDNDGVVRVSSSAVYVELASGASGRTKGLPKVLSSMSIGGSLVLDPAFQGGEPREAWFYLNRFSGSLVIGFPGENGKILFAGTCKHQAPLF